MRHEIDMVVMGVQRDTDTPNTGSVFLKQASNNLGYNFIIQKKELSGWGKLVGTSVKVTVEDKPVKVK